MERFDIIELITSIVNANELRASQKGIQIEFNQRDEHIDVWSDEYKIEEVVTNYITNAINHCDFENRIEVSVERIGDDVRVHVFNTGKNIPEEDIPNIWQKFYKVDKAAYQRVRRQRYWTFYCKSHHGFLWKRIWCHQ